METGNTFKAIIAMRIRLGLLRVKIAIDAERLVRDAAYAAAVLGHCRQSGLAELKKLADSFEAGAPDSQAFGNSGSVPDASPGPSGPSELESGRDPNDPHTQRNQRYLRGAR